MRTNTANCTICNSYSSDSTHEHSIIFGNCICVYYSFKEINQAQKANKSMVNGLCYVNKIIHTMILLKIVIEQSDAVLILYPIGL